MSLTQIKKLPVSSTLLVLTFISSLLVTFTSTRTFTRNTINPFHEFEVANLFGSISTQDRINRNDQFTMFTLSFLTTRGKEFFIYISYTPSSEYFFVKKFYEARNKEVIKDKDLLYFGSPSTPFIVLFGVCKEHNPLFDEQVKGLENIEKALNENMSNSEDDLVILQEMSMFQFIQKELEFNNIGNVWYYHQELLNTDSAPSDKFPPKKPIEFFKISTGVSNLMGLRNMILGKLKVLLRIMVNEFFTILTPNKKNDEIKKPKTPEMELANKVYEATFKKFDLLFTTSEHADLITKHIFESIIQVRKILNIGIKKFVFEPESNFLIDPLVFDRPSYYFADKKQVPITEFAAKYKDEFFDKVIPDVQMETEEGGFIDTMRLYLQEFMEDFKNLMVALKTPGWDSILAALMSSRDRFLTKINLLQFFVTPEISVGIRNGIYFYLAAMRDHSHLAHMDLFNRSINTVDIDKLTEVYRVFSPERSNSTGYVVDTPVFIVKDEKKKKHKQED